MIARIDIVNWGGANFKERMLCSIFSTYLKFVTHDEAMTILLSLLSNSIEREDEIDLIIEEIANMKRKPPQ
jgi:hypothetical protein